jgi:hypothetical protein
LNANKKAQMKTNQEYEKQGLHEPKRDILK